MTQAATGQSLHLNSYEAGRQAAESAAERLGTDRPDLVVAFATTGHDQPRVLEGITNVFEDAPLSGCSAEGVITRAGACEDTHVVALMAIASERMDFHTVLAGDYSLDSAACADQLVDELGDAALQKGQLLLVFPALRGGDCSVLLERLGELVPSTVTVAGGMAGNILTQGQPNDSPTFQYCDGAAVDDGVAAVLIGGDIDTQIAVSHGCEPVGRELEVTQSNDTKVELIDGRPARELIVDYLPEDPGMLAAEEMMHLSVGMKLADSESNYVIRTPLAADASEGSLWFAVSIDEGTRVSIVRRDPRKVSESAARTARQLKQYRRESPAFVLHFDCCGRGRTLFRSSAEEMGIQPMLQQFDENVPWAGFYTMGEIAPLRGQPFYHNYTAVLCAVYDQPGE